MKILNKIKTALYAIELILSIAGVVLFMAIFKDKNRQIRRMWAKLQRFFIGYQLEVVGNPIDEANLIIINHQSVLDIIVMEEIHPANLSWIAKKEIGKIPIIGKILTIPKMIPVDRNDPRSLPKLIKDVKDRVDNNRVVAMFPEGTRSEGDKLLKFQSGAKIIVSKLNLKVQPVLIINSRNILDTKKFKLNSGLLKVIYMDLVDTSSENWLEETRAKMQTLLDQNI
ncbi:lysophospholipid acyltransferase family protein [Campylobacter fetus]|uniref:1-acyl-sn-glycerol-3-phosphate acyltransferase n=1 Tax=Campylobacter fetus subsp. testudinum TaxID=1507806 RepID=A0AAX0H9H6_CAMFE|nr:lysophospholipid acyltransferase family protein [Campylobacter fetus]AGZ81806.1 1-acylglycerol-3-phosphate O-acyltransferase [Campylobacter fetus subsp. testudinum 03-427]AJB45538.1 acyl-phosphate glycerol 3-phosphate acyltransferase [Campylobacter fetus subsp. testudinum]ALV64962.1 1-acylglycerol-3-phosphate O-acyltransferase [Campylobacter fetus subsp. testudinum Sp3]AVK81208.1 1-acyl-sn-glycerol-3-phosphate acyltransferase [Campylobacter fetus subsp. testudinum]EAI4321218.1 1-acyl-sn-gly